MKFKLKKIIYLANDITNVLLKKDRDQIINSYKKLRVALIIVSLLLILSLALNFYFYAK